MNYGLGFNPFRWRRNKRRFVPAPTRKAANVALDWDYTDRTFERRGHVLTNWHTEIMFTNKRMRKI